MAYRRVGMLLVGLLVGCAQTLISLDTIRSEGYQRIPVMTITPSGESRESEEVELWVKESREDGRTLRACLLPKSEGAGYNWRLEVFVDSKGIWTYESGPMMRHMGAASLRRGIDCTVSRDLPEGRLNLGVGYVYWE